MKQLQLQLLIIIVNKTEVFTISVGKNLQVSADILLWPARLSETSLPSCPLAVCVYNTSISSAKQLKPNF